MRASSGPDSNEHYRRQRAYFERTVKPTMIPADSPYLRRHVEEALRFGAISLEERVLEIGCGMGRYTLLLAQRGVRVEGLDLSPVLLDRLRAYEDGRFRIPLYCCDIENPPRELEGSYDVILGFFTLHHIYALDRCFAALACLLKPGGRVVFLEPNPFNPLYYIQMLVTPAMTWQGDGGIVRMRPRIIFHELERAGFTRPALARFGFLPPFLANRRWGWRLESACERFPLWRGLLPFQLFRAEKL